MNFLKCCFCFYSLYSLLCNNLFAQNSQVIRGVVIDAISQSPLIGATVVLASINPVQSVISDEKGNFELNNVSVGRHRILVSYIGYYQRTIDNILVNAGKETIITIAMDESVLQQKEVVITSNKLKNESLNELSLVSTRMFSVEETQKFAAAVNDPARMVQSFSGVVGTDDGNNNISIRGNAPYTLQWRLEGIEIPNPNHFSSVGTSGGGVMILSSQLLSNSDFMTGAFTSEYGNALSGVFDMKLRKGNNKKQEYTSQLNLLGVDLAAEGPLCKKYDGSYLINYRYSTLSFLSNIGVKIGGGVTRFQDLSWHFYLPTKQVGSFSLFGFGGLSNQKFNAKEDSTKWEIEDDRITTLFESNTYAVGLSHIFFISNKSFIKTAFINSGNLIQFTMNRINNEYESELRIHDYNNISKNTLSSVFTHKVSSRLSIKSGVIFSIPQFKIVNDIYNDSLLVMKELLNKKARAGLFQGFINTNYKAGKKWVFNAGLHFMYFDLNRNNAIEPRFSARYSFSPSHSLSVAYGSHHQNMPLQIYFVKHTDNQKGNIFPNNELKLPFSQHFVLTYRWDLSQYIYLKSEAYIQLLKGVPVSVDTANRFSILNYEGGYSELILSNKGQGRNYGLEVTLEQFLNKGFYYLVSISLFDSKYLAANDKWYNTRFNSNYTVSFTSGHEFISKRFLKKYILGINLKTMYRGGLRETPINRDLSMIYGSAVFENDKPFLNRVSDYFRTDVRLSLKRNRIKSTHTLSLDIQNATNRKNVYGNYYESETGSIKTLYQSPLIPVLGYRIEF